MSDKKPRFWKTRQGIIGFVVGVLVVLSVILCFKACEIVLMIDPPDYLTQNISGSNLTTIMPWSDEQIIKIKRGSKEYVISLDCRRNRHNKLVFTSEGDKAFFTCYYTDGERTVVKLLYLPRKDESLDNVQIETVLTDEEIKKMIENERAWPNRVYAVSTDGNRLLLNISFEDPEVDGKYYMQRPFVYDLLKNTLTMVDLDIDVNKEKKP